MIVLQWSTIALMVQDFSLWLDILGILALKEIKLVEPCCVRFDLRDLTLLMNTVAKSDLLKCLGLSWGLRSASVLCTIWEHCIPGVQGTIQTHA
jgi:hypothetical protein